MSPGTRYDLINAMDSSIATIRTLAELASR